MKKSLLFVAIVIIIFAGFIALRKQRTSENTKQTEPVPTSLIQKQVTPTIILSQTGTQIQGQSKIIPLVVSEPSNNMVTTSPTISVKGKTVANADISINEKDLKADAQGNFSTTISMEEGENIIAVLAVDEAGNFVEQDLIVTLNSGTQ